MDTKALRQKILDLAIRGKLVPQDPADEPASVLLERIRAEKQQMVKDGKLKAKDIKNDTVIYVGEDNLHYEKFSDGTVKCIEDEIPFEIPNGWAWARLRSLLNLFITGPFGSSLHKSDYVSSGTPLINPMNIVNERIQANPQMLVSQDTVSRLSVFKVLEGDIVIARRGEMGRCAVVDSSQNGWLCGTGSFDLRVSHLIDSNYIAARIRASDSVTFLSGNSLGNTMLNLNQSILNSLLIPVPPFNEQRRVLCAISEANGLLSTLAESNTKVRTFIVDAKAKILDLAIRGKLVPQDPADEPASVLLERIRADKEEQIKAGKIKRDKKESFIFRGEDNSYYLSRSTHKEQVDGQFIFPLPPGWQWCTLSNVSHFELGKTLDQGKNTGDYYPYLRSANIKWDSIDLADLKEMRFEKEELDRYTIIKNDLLICEGGDVGRCCVWESTNTIMYQNALHRVRFFENCNPFFFMFYMWHYELDGILKPICNGVTIKHLTGDVLRSIPFALPPVEEQNRIVAKIREYFQVIEILQ